MTTRRLFGYSGKGSFNQALLDAIRASRPTCEACRDIEREVDEVPGGAEFTEAASFPGRTLDKLNAHFKAHWKEEYELVDLSGRRTS
jgi:hypothetical protein